MRPAVARAASGLAASRSLTDRGEPERAFQLAQQLGSVNAAPAELGTTWPSLRKAFTHHGLGMPTPDPEAVRQRAIAAARQRSGQSASGCRNLSTSRDMGILVDQPAEPIASHDLCVGHASGRQASPHRWRLAERATGRCRL